MIPYTADDANILAEVLREYTIPLIACSSLDIYKAFWILWETEEYKQLQKCPIKETDELRSKLWHGWAEYDKLSVEKIYLDLPWDVTILRLPMIYWYPEFTRIEEYLGQMLDWKEVIQIEDWREEWKWSRATNKNCAYAVFLSRNATWKTIYNVAENINYTETEWLNKIAKYVSWKWKTTWWSVKLPLNWGQNWYIDTSKIREELWFYEKYNPDETLYDCILEYIREKNNIKYNKNY